jgi:hypothetical protein
MKWYPKNATGTFDTYNVSKLVLKIDEANDQPWIKAEPAIAASIPQRKERSPKHIANPTAADIDPRRWRSRMDHQYLDCDKVTIEQLRREIHTLVETKTRAELLSTQALAFFKYLNRMLETTNATTESALQLVNYAISQLQEHGCEKMTNWWYLGLFYATSIRDLDLMEKYLQASLQAPPLKGTGSGKNAILAALYATLAASPAKPGTSVKDSANPALKRYLTFLTGWERNGMESSVDFERQPSLRDLAIASGRPGARTGQYLKYVECLSLPGFSDALWAEWADYCASHVLLKRHQIAEGGTHFMNAFLVAGDPMSALRLLGELKETGAYCRVEDLQAVTGSKWPMSSFYASKEFVSKMRKMLERHFEEFGVAEEGRLRKSYEEKGKELRVW